MSSGSTRPTGRTEIQPENPYRFVLWTVSRLFVCFVEENESVSGRGQSERYSQPLLRVTKRPGPYTVDEVVPLNPITPRNVRLVTNYSRHCCLFFVFTSIFFRFLCKILINWRDRSRRTLYTRGFCPCCWWF